MKGSYIFIGYWTTRSGSNDKSWQWMRVDEKWRKKKLYINTQGEMSHNAIMCALMLRRPFKWHVGGVVEGHLCGHMLPFTHQSPTCETGAVVACLPACLPVWLFSESFFYRFDLDPGGGGLEPTHAPMHTFGHTRVNAWVSKWPCMLGELSNTLSPLLGSSRPPLYPLFFPSYFYLSVYSANCFLSALELDLCSTGCYRGFVRSSDGYFLKNVTTHLWRWDSNVWDHQLWVVGWDCLCYTLDEGRVCW